MTPLSALLRRHRERLRAAGPLLWVNPPMDLPSDLVTDHGQTAGSRVFTQDEMTRRALAERGITADFGAFPPPEPTWRAAVLALPREKALTDALAHALAASAASRPLTSTAPETQPDSEPDKAPDMPPDTRPRDTPDPVLFAAGETRAGARSAAARLEARFGDVQKVDSARHCVLYECRQPLPGAFDPAELLTAWRLRDVGLDLEIRSLPGVFSHGRLDDGTALLLDAFDALLADRPGSALDVGCGAGVIGAALAKQVPALRLTCCDASALALASTRATLAANGVEATVVASDGLRGVDGRFDLVVSNPPFHAGHRQRADLGAGVFDGITDRLKPGGRLVMVVNRHLPWRNWLDATFGAHSLLAENRRYRVLEARSTTSR